MAQESDDSDSGSIPMGRPGGFEDDMIFVPVLANDVDLDEKRTTITPQTGQAALVSMNQMNSIQESRDEKFDTDDEEDDEPNMNGMYKS